MENFREEFPRLYELKDAIADPNSPAAYFVGFEKTLADFADARELYRRRERALQDLDDTA